MVCQLQRDEEINDDPVSKFMLVTLLNIIYLQYIK